MKTKIIPLSSLLFLILVLIGCKATQGISKEEKIIDVDNKVQAQSYTFEVTQASPVGGRTVHLTSSYSLKVRPDSVIAHLPYFGRAYSAPSPMEEGGIKFASTDYSYSVSEKEKGTYRVSIEIKDNPNKYNLSLLIGENGKGTLHVTQINKQSITFYGDME